MKRSSPRRLDGARSSIRTTLVALAVPALVFGGVLADSVLAPPASASGPIDPVGRTKPADGFPDVGGVYLAQQGTESQTFYAYTAADEQFQALFEAASRGTVLDIVVTSPSGQVFTQAKPGYPANGSLWGFDRGELPSEEGIWRVELVNHAGLTENAGLGLTSSWSAVYAADGTERPGRVWTQSLMLADFGGGPPTSHEVYYLSSLGYTYQANYDGVYGGGWVLSADAYGNVAVNPDGSLDCTTSSYRSFAYPVNTLQSALNGNGVDAYAYGRCGGVYRMFFSEPFTADGPGAVPEATGNSAGPSDWVRPQIATPYLKLTDYQPAGSSGGDLTVTLDAANFSGFIDVEVLDGDGAVLRTVRWNVPEGEGPSQVSLPFDGLDDGGNPISPDRIKRFQIVTAKTAVIHFPLQDIEQLRGGMRIEALNGTAAGTPEATRLYWADADNRDGAAGTCMVPAASVNTRDDGVLSDPCVRASSAFGNQTVVDQWTYADVVASSALILQSGFAVDIEKSTNGEDADTGTGPAVDEGDPVTWTYVVTNTGDVELFDLTVTDDKVAAALVDCDGTGSNVVAGPLAPGDSFECVARGTALVGQYENLGTVTARGDDIVDENGATLSSVTVGDDDLSHYIAADAPVDPSAPPGALARTGASSPWGPLMTAAALLGLGAWLALARRKRRSAARAER